MALTDSAGNAKSISNQNLDDKRQPDAECDVVKAVDVVRFTDSATSSSSSSSSSSSEHSYPSPPDGGWGWVIVAASFTAHLIADGFAASVGILYAELLDVFGGSKAETAWVGSLFVSMPALCGPIASILTNHFGCRRSTIAGGIIAAVGCVLASFSSNLSTVCVFFGVVAGFGLSLVYMPAIIIVAFYFEKRRALATGLAVAGSGTGAFICAPLLKLLIDTYGWRGALLIMGGLMLNIVVCGCLFRPLESFKMQRQRRRYLRSLERFSRVSSRRTSGDALDRQSGQTCNHEDDGEGALPVCDLCKDAEPLSHSLIQFPTYLQNGVVHDELMMHHLPRRCSQSLVNLSPPGADLKIPVYAEFSPNRNDPYSVTLTPPQCIEQEPQAIKLKRVKKEKPDPNKRQTHFSETYAPRYRADIIYRGSLLKSGFLLSQSHSASCPDIIIHTRPKHKDGLCSRLRNALPGLLSHVRYALDFSIFKSPIFLLFCVHCMLYNMSYEIPYMYIADYASDADSHLEVSYLGESLLISVIGIVSTFGQVVMGYIGDRPSVNRVQFYVAMTFLAGVATVVVPLLPTTFSWLATYCGVFGFFVSANFTLVTIILVELLGMDQLTNSYGFVSLAEGIACLIGPPIAGALADVTGDYELAFYAAGVVICLSAVILLLNPCLRPFDHVVARLSDCEDDISVDGGDVKQKFVIDDSADEIDTKHATVDGVYTV